jgi:protein arginine N-methyltransferase 1
MALRAGQTLAARLRSTTSNEKGTNVTWTLSVRDASGREVARQALDLEKGYLP